MTKKVTLIFLLSFSFLITFASLSAALFESEVKTANKLMQKAGELKQIGMDKEAREKLREAETILIKELTENTKNLEALYTLGTCYFYQGNDNEADEKFTIAYKHDQKYGQKIFNFYLNEGYKLIKKQPDKYLTLVKRACYYQPGQQEKLAQDLLKDGEKLLNNGDYNLAELYFKTASRLNQSLSQNIAHTYFEFGKTQKKSINQIRLWRYSLAYGNDYEQDISKATIELLKQTGLKPVKKELDRFPKTIKETIISTAFPPDYKIYRPGNYTFSLKAGQKTDHWIMFPYGRITNYTIGSDDDKFKLQYSDGEIVPAWTPGEWPEKKETKFKIVAVTDQPNIKMIVK